jgi:hypothetical protein
MAHIRNRTKAPVGGQKIKAGFAPALLISNSPALTNLSKSPTPILGPIPYPSLYKVRYRQTVGTCLCNPTTFKLTVVVVSLVTTENTSTLPMQAQFLGESNELKIEPVSSFQLTPFVDAVFYSTQNQTT